MSFMDPTPKIPSSREAQQIVKTNYGSSDLSQAAQLACWMILEKNFPLDRSKRTAAKKYNVAMAPIERIVREIIPEHFFLDRSKYGSPRGSKAIAQNNQVARKHMVSINESAPA